MRQFLSGSLTRRTMVLPHSQLQMGSSLFLRNPHNHNRHNFHNILPGHTHQHDNQKHPRKSIQIIDENSQIQRLKRSQSDSLRHKTNSRRLQKKNNEQNNNNKSEEIHHPRSIQIQITKNTNPHSLPRRLHLLSAVSFTHTHARSIRLQHLHQWSCNIVVTSNSRNFRISDNS